MLKVNNKKLKAYDIIKSLLDLALQRKVLKNKYEIKSSQRHEISI